MKTTITALVLFTKNQFSVKFSEKQFLYSSLTLRTQYKVSRNNKQTMRWFHSNQCHTFYQKNKTQVIFKYGKNISYTKLIILINGNFWQITYISNMTDLTNFVDFLWLKKCSFRNIFLWVFSNSSNVLSPVYWRLIFSFMNLFISDSFNVINFNKCHHFLNDALILYRSVLL